MCVCVCVCVCMCVWNMGRDILPLKIKSISLSHYETLVVTFYSALIIIRYFCIVAVIMNFGTDVITSHSL